MKNVDLVGRIKYWSKINEISFNADIYKWWKISTSISSILEKFIDTKNYNYFMNSKFFTKGAIPTDKNKNNTSDTYIIDGLKSPVSKSTLKQYISISIIFGVFKLDIIPKIKIKNDFFYDWLSDKIDLIYSENFKKSNNINDYLTNNIDYIKNNWKIIMNSFSESFLLNDLGKILFDMFVFLHINKEGNVSDISSEIDKMVVKNKSQKLDTTKIIDEYNMNKKIISFIEKILEVTK